MLLISILYFSLKNFSISYKVALVVMNSLHFYLSGKAFFSLLFLDNFVRQSILG